MGCERAIARDLAPRVAPSASRSPLPLESLEIHHPRAPRAPAALALLLLLCACSSPSSVSAAFPPLTAATVARAEKAILATVGLPEEGTYGKYCNPCPFGDIIGGLVRLPFHDAAGGGRPSKKGGPNGCIDFTYAGNAGLQDAVANLSLAYTGGGFDALMSRGDFWVLAGNLAVRVASTLPPGTLPQGGLPLPGEPLRLPFRYGRVDDASCDGVDAAFLPSPHFSYAQTAAVFCARLGMTPKQLVAIMGAHTLGRARAAESGFDGGWSGFSSSFSVMYYWQLIAVQWINKDAPAADEWLAPPPAPGSPGDAQLINLKGSDVELVISPSDGCSSFNERNFTAPTPTPRPGNSCPVNALNVAALKLYSQNQTAWWEDFAGAWQVMTEFSYAPGELQPVGP